jgi:L-ribulose-5-phosphate 3-epimerase
MTRPEPDTMCAVKDSVSSECRPEGPRTAAPQAAILPPGHNCLTRRAAIRAILASTGAAALSSEVRAQKMERKPDPRKGSPKRYAMKKSINQWAFPYPQRMSLKECLQLAKDAGFDGIELNYDLENDLSPRSGTKDYQEIRKLAERIGIEISGLCSFLFWPYPLTSSDPDKRAKGMELAGKIIQAAHELAVENVLLVPGAVDIPWRDDYEPVPNDLCDRRAKEAVKKLLGQAERLNVRLNIENIFFSGYLMTPMEMNDFVDSFQSEHVKIHFDTGNISIFQHPEHWVPIMGKRIKNTHFKEFSKKSTDYSLETFRPLLDGTTNWPAVMEELDKVEYRGYVTFEYFHPYPHYPEALIYHTSDSLDRILGRIA